MANPKPNSHKPDAKTVKPEAKTPEPGKRDSEKKTVKPESQHPPIVEPQVEGDSAETVSVVDNSVTKLRAELQAAKDRELRGYAELDNYRKRASRELEDGMRYANMGLFRELLPVLDNVERAIQAGEKSADAATLLDGFKMVQQQIENVLKQHHCERIEALHAPFDPNFHHAVMQQPSGEYPANTVLMVTQNGYQLYDRVVRPSQVIVSKAE